MPQRVFLRSAAFIAQRFGMLRSLRSFARHYFQNHLQVFATQNQELLRVVLSEVLVNAEIRERYIQQIVGPTFVKVLQQLAPLPEQDSMPSAKLQLTTQLMSSMLLGVLMSRMLDEQSAQDTWDHLPAVLTNLFCEGLLDQ